MRTNAPTVYNLEGLGAQVGGSYSAGEGFIVAGGGEANYIPSDTGDGYVGTTISAGVGVGSTGAEVHTEWGETKTIASFNVWEMFKNVIGGIDEFFFPRALSE